jgi:hypothetical protein
MLVNTEADDISEFALARKLLKIRSEARLIATTLVPDCPVTVELY